jgi:hypothetical protein
MPSASSTRLSLSSAMQHQLSGDPAASARFHSLYRTDSAPVCSAPASAGRTGGGDRDTQPRWAVCSPRPCAQPGKHPTATPLRPLTLSDYPRRRITLDSSNIYNTVILTACWKTQLCHEWPPCQWCVRIRANDCRRSCSSSVNTSGCFCRPVRIQDLP